MLFHLITLSARASTFCEIVQPICLAVFKLITSSNLVGCSTGSSAGCAPFRILSMYHAARRKLSSITGCIGHQGTAPLLSHFLRASNAVGSLWQGLQSALSNL